MSEPIYCPFLFGLTPDQEASDYPIWWERIHQVDWREHWVNNSEAQKALKRDCPRLASVPLEIAFDIGWFCWDHFFDDDTTHNYVFRPYWPRDWMKLVYLVLEYDSKEPDAELLRLRQHFWRWFPIYVAEREKHGIVAS